MKKGEMVKYKKPIDIKEEDERFVVLEDRGDRILVGTLFINLRFGSTTVLKTDDLTAAIPYEEGQVAGLADAMKTEPFLTLSPYPTETRERLDWNRGYHESLSQGGEKGQSCK